MTSYRLVCVRHGWSSFNRDNLFTGWHDALLNDTGIAEAESCGEDLKKGQFIFDEAFCSILTRSKKTLDIILEKIGQTDIPIHASWRLNERHYGALTGFNKVALAGKYGQQQILQWRRSFNIPPPPMTSTHPFYDTIVNDPRYASGPPLHEFPIGETIKMTVERIRPYWENFIGPKVLDGRRILIVGHGNTLRSLSAMIENQECETSMRNVRMPPTGIPYYYELDENLQATEPLEFICSDQEKLYKVRQKMKKDIE